MARRLVRGAVKRRLAARLGDDEALAVYASLLSSTLTQAERLDGVELILAVPAATGGEAAASDPLAGRSAPWRRLEQRGAGLGERLANVFTDLFAQGAAAVVAVASDSPPIPLRYLQQAVAQLRPGRLVLGPAADGGYYQIGCDCATWRRHGPALTRLLRDSPMSTPRLLEHTLREVRALGLETRQTPL